jgi:hypothetical protein
MICSRTLALTLALTGIAPLRALAQHAEAPSHAQDDMAQRKQEAKRLLEDGNQQWDRGEYLTALAFFEHAYALYPSPRLRFNIARVLTDLGRDLEALEAFEAFVGDERNQPADAVGVAKAKIAVLERKIGRVSVRCSSPGEISLDGKQIGSGPLDRTLRVSPGIHEVTAQRGGFAPYVAGVTVLPGDTKPVDVRFHKLGSDKPVAKRAWFWVTIIGVTAVAATGVALALKYGIPGPPEPTYRASKALSTP